MKCLLNPPSLEEDELRHGACVNLPRSRTSACALYLPPSAPQRLSSSMPQALQICAMILDESWLSVSATLSFHLTYLKSTEATNCPKLQFSSFFRRIGVLTIPLVLVLNLVHLSFYQTTNALVSSSMQPKILMHIHGMQYAHQ